MLLCDYFKEVKCFKDINLSSKDFVKLIHYITLQFLPCYEVLFNLGDIGSSFYVCLSG